MTGMLDLLKNPRHNIWKRYRFILYPTFLAYYGLDDDSGSALLTPGTPNGLVPLKYITQLTNDDNNDRIPRMPLSEKRESRIDKDPSRAPGYFTGCFLLTCSRNSSADAASMRQAFSGPRGVVTCH